MKIGELWVIEDNFSVIGPFKTMKAAKSEAEKYNDCSFIVTVAAYQREIETVWVEK